MKKLVSVTILSLFTANAFAISFGIPGVGSVHIGEGGKPFRPPTGGGGVIGNIIGSTLPIQIPGSVIDKKMNQIGDGLANVVTFGKVGRDRDKERAEAAEREAKAVRDGADKAKTEKRLGLLRSIEIAKKNVQDWEDVQSQGPAVVASYDRLFSAAQKELQERTKLDAHLRAAMNSAKEGGVALQLLSGLLSSEDPGQNGYANMHSSLSKWVKGGEQLEKIAKNSNMSTTQFVGRAIATADENTLQQFITVVGQTRAQINGMVSMSGEKLLKARLVKEGLERELSAVN